MIRLINLLDRFLGRIELFMVILLILVMVFMAFAQVIMRNLFSAGIIWGDIFLRHLVLWVGFIGASIAAREARHINIDALNRILPAKVKPFIKIVIDLVTAVTCFILAKAGYVFMMLEKDAGSTLFREVPSWWFELIIPLGFGLIGLRFLMRMVQDFTNKEKPDLPLSDVKTDQV